MIKLFTGIVNAASLKITIFQWTFVRQVLRSSQLRDQINITIFSHFIIIQFWIISWISSAIFLLFSKWQYFYLWVSQKIWWRGETGTRKVVPVLGVSQWKDWSIIHRMSQHTNHFTPVQGIEESDSARRVPILILHFKCWYWRCQIFVDRWLQIQ